MNATLNPTSLPQLKLLEDFFNDYPAEKAEQLLWCWFVACLRNDFSKISQEELQEFSDFFERLNKLELAMQLKCKEILKNKGGLV